MTGSDEFSLGSAQRAESEGRLAEWVLDFLKSPGSDNEPLAADLAFSDAAYVGPIRFELNRLTPMAGPDEDDVVVPVAEEDWESDVEAMKHSVDQGWHPPPLLVSHRDGQYFLEDGNHRYETLRRNGASHAWAIVVFADEAKRDANSAETGPEGSTEYKASGPAGSRAEPSAPPTQGRKSDHNEIEDGSVSAD